MVSSTPRPHYTPGKDRIPILQEAGCAPGQVWKGGKARPHLDSIPDRPARSLSLYRLSYPAYTEMYIVTKTVKLIPTFVEVEVSLLCTAKHFFDITIFLCLPVMQNFVPAPSPLYSQKNTPWRKRDGWCNEYKIFTAVFEALR